MTALHLISERKRAISMLLAAAPARLTRTPGRCTLAGAETAREAIPDSRMMPSALGPYTGHKMRLQCGSGIRGVVRQMKYWNYVLKMSIKPRTKRLKPDDEVTTTTFRNHLMR